MHASSSNLKGLVFIDSIFLSISYYFLVFKFMQLLYMVNMYEIELYYVLFIPIEMYHLQMIGSIPHSTTWVESCRKVI